MSLNEDKNTIALQGDISLIFEMSKIPFIITDSFQKDNPIIIANNAFMDMTGYNHKEVIGHNCRFLQGLYTSKDTIQKIRIALSSNRSISCVVLNYTKQQQPFWNALFIAPLKNEKGENQYFIASQIDATNIMGCQQSLDLVHATNRDATDAILDFANEKYANSAEFKRAEEQCVAKHFSSIFNFLDTQNIADTSVLSDLIARKSAEDVSISFKI